MDGKGDRDQDHVQNPLHHVLILFVFIQKLYQVVDDPKISLFDLHVLDEILLCYSAVVVNNCLQQFFESLGSDEYFCLNISRVFFTLFCRRLFNLLNTHEDSKDCLEETSEEAILNRVKEHGLVLAHEN